MSAPLAAPLPHRSLRAQAVKCVRGDRIVFSDVDLALPAGGLLQISGPNGSGKTSLLRIVCGLIPPAGGKIFWDDRDVVSLGDDFHRELAYVGHLNAIKDELSVRENLRFNAQLAGLSVAQKEIELALADFAFGGLEHRPGKYLSQGQKRRLGLARLKLAGARPLWVLDEPFAALDAAGIEMVRTMLEAHLARGGLVLLTTHQEIAIAAPEFRRIELTQ